MTLYLALLRGINVGGRSRVPMKELAAAMQSNGYENVTSYLQTGNVFFESEQTDVNELASDLQELILTEFGTTTPVVIRTSDQYEAASTTHPFGDHEDDFKKLHVMFLDLEPEPAAIEGLDSDRSPGDSFRVDGREIYLHLRNGAGRTKLTIDYFERCLGVVATGRNWNTVQTLRSMMETRAD